MTLDDRSDRLGQTPAAGEDAADQRVVDTELTTLAVDALLRGAGTLVDLGGIARVGVHQDELADVVQQRGDHQAVALGIAGLDGQALGGALGGDTVQTETLGRGVPDGAALEEVEGPGAGGKRLDGLGREQIDGGDDRLDLAAGLALDLVGQAQHGDHQRDVGLDGGHDLASADALLLDQPQKAVARLGEGRERLERLEGGCQATTMALVVAALRCLRPMGGRAKRNGLGHWIHCILGGMTGWVWFGGAHSRRGTCRTKGSPGLSAGMDG